MKLPEEDLKRLSQDVFTEVDRITSMLPTFTTMLKLSVDIKTRLRKWLNVDPVDARFDGRTCSVIVTISYCGVKYVIQCLPPRVVLVMAEDEK